MFTYDLPPDNGKGAIASPIQIVARGSIGFDAYHGYQKSEGDCVAKGENCRAYTNIPKNIRWININNAYGIEAPFNPYFPDYYLTNIKKSNQVIRIYIHNVFRNRVLNKDELHLLEQVVRTLRFERE